MLTQKGNDNWLEVHCQIVIIHYNVYGLSDIYQLQLAFGLDMFTRFEFNSKVMHSHTLENEWNED